MIGSCSHSMRVAIYQLGRFHTETFGFLLDALERSGVTVVIYNNVESDPFSFLAYYTELFARPLDIRPCDRLLAEHSGYDRIIMATVDDFIWPELSHGESCKIIAIEHERGWWRPELSCHVGLSPFVSIPHMFPVYSPVSDHVHTSPKASDELHLAIVGDVTDTKHMEEMNAFLDHSPGTKISFFARKATDLVHRLGAEYAGKVLMREDVSTGDLIGALESDDIDGIWTPIRHGVNHSTFKLTGALPLAFNLGKLLVVPDMIAEAYGLEGAVVYRSGVAGLREMLAGWDTRSKEDFRDLSRRATAFVQQTVFNNGRLLQQMLETGTGATAHPSG